MGKRCLFCGRFFSPDPRVGTRQQACGRPACGRARKRQAHQRWRQHNLGYFKHHYRDYVKPWRERRRALRLEASRGSEVIKDEIAPERLILLIPAGRGGMIKEEILLRRYLESGVMVGGVIQEREEGTPQGGPLSPLLSNILLDDLDKELERRGHRFCRYADDCNIYVRSRKAGERVMESISRFLEKRLRLIIDGETVITGSFNFTKSAEESNAENLLVIHDKTLAERYTKNWENHAGHSEVYRGRGR